MTTLQAIGFTLAGGSAVTIVSLGLLGAAVSNRSIFIAPRATARPRNVIYNPHPTFHTAAQDRGGPIFGWIPWVMTLTYDTMLHGVPGTGTRKGGMAGSMLRVNMDGIVLLRFHALCRRVALLASFLCIAIILPVYYSAQCFTNAQQSGARCSAPNYNLTNYERLTLINVPPLSGENSADSPDTPNDGTSARLYCVCFSFWVLVAYTLRQLDLEWVQVLAMRRVYFLESNVWGQRRHELAQTLMYDELNPPQQESQEDRKLLVEREAWIPHPEQRETVPNVALYSVLVGGLPSLPDEAVAFEGASEELANPKRDSVDWQLLLASAFFDHCVPNQPGFSSSVAAVTVIPGAKEITNAWRKWYTAASKLRRLRYIRKLIAERRQYDIEDISEDEETGAVPGDTQQSEASRNDAQYDIVDQDDNREHEASGVTCAESSSSRKIYQALSQRRSYYREIFSSHADDEAEDHIHEAVLFGPEQAAIYSREFAQAAAPCCPYGCRQERLMRAQMDELLEAETQAAEEVHQANIELKECRLQVAHCPPMPLRAPLRGDDSVASPSCQSGSQKTARISCTIQEDRMPSNFSLETDLFKRSLSPSQQIRKETGKAAYSEWLRMSNLQNDNSPAVGGLNGSSVSMDMVSPLPVKPRSSNERIVQIADDVMAKDSDQMIPLDARPGERTSQNAKGPQEEGRSQSFTRSWPESSLRLRQKTESSWATVVSIVAESGISDLPTSRNLQQDISSGSWAWPTWKSVSDSTKTALKNANKWAKKQTEEAVDRLARDSTYAIVTFTSRQAAVAARNCLADGRGASRWIAQPGIPTPPLADAPACDLAACRNCCRPVTMNINDRQKCVRRHLAITLLVAIYIFYTVPLTFASQLVSQENLQNLFPLLHEWSLISGVRVTQLLSGLMSALIWSAFFAVCPVMFKAIANFGSAASSVAQAEFEALQYYWWFMIITAFSGNILATMVLTGFNEGLSLDSSFRSILKTVAITIPSTTAATWLNWIIFRFTIILPGNYLLQINTFLFHLLGWKCCSRIVRGGGPGGPTPYRIYVDSGVVLLTTLALAPASPLIAPASLIYFLVSEPIWRRNLIFLYRPNYDAGGVRWPFLFNMVVSSTMYASILLATQMALKQAFGPTIVAGLPLIPAWLFQQHARKKYGPAYEDAALLQTSLLDGWDTLAESTFEQREEFRRFLVDAHRAAYVPVCLADSDTDEFLTVEPAVVVPLESDFRPTVPTIYESCTAGREYSGGSAGSKTQQRGATMRRTAHAINLLRQRKSDLSISQSSLLEDSYLHFTPIPVSNTGDASEKSE